MEFARPDEATGLQIFTEKPNMIERQVLYKLPGRIGLGGKAIQPVILLLVVPSDPFKKHRDFSSVYGSVRSRQQSDAPVIAMEQA